MTTTAHPPPLYGLSTSSSSISSGSASIKTNENKALGITASVFCRSVFLLQAEQLAPRASFLGKASSVVSRAQPAVEFREPLSEHEKEKRARKAGGRKKKVRHVRVSRVLPLVSQGCTCTALFWRLSVFPHRQLSAFPHFCISAFPHFRIFVFSLDPAAILMPVCLPALPLRAEASGVFFTSPLG